MWNPLNRHLELISFILTKHCLIKKPPLFSLHSAPLDLVFFLKYTDCFVRRHQKSLASKTSCNVAAKYQFRYLGSFMSCIKA